MAVLHGLGWGQPSSVQALMARAVQLREQGRVSEALPVAEQALSLAEQQYGADALETATGANLLALVAYDAGDYARAGPLLERALAIREKALGPDDPLVAVTLNNLALVHKASGDYAGARPRYERALAIMEKARNDAAVATTLINLASLDEEQGSYEKARPLLERALAIRQAALGPMDPGVAVALNNLGLLDEAVGEYGRSRLCLERALEIRRQALGPDHPDVATGLDNLAGLYQAMGDTDKARPLLEQALAIRDKALGAEHPDVARSLNNLAALEQVLGDLTQARAHYERALAIQEKALGPDHVDVARTLNNLGVLDRLMGDYAAARPEYERALAIREKVLGAEHPDVAVSLSNLARLDQVQGDYAQARLLDERALGIRTRVLAPDHPDLARSLSNLALLDVDQGRVSEALSTGRRAQEVNDRILARVLSFTTESERLAFQAQTDPYTLLATLGDAPGLAEAILRHKGVVLDSLAEDLQVAQASRNPDLQEAMERLRADKRRLQQGQGDPQAVDREEGALARKVAGLGRARRALSVTVAEVQHVLPSHTVLVEFLRYSHYTGRGTFEFRYGAVVMAAAGAPRWVPLGPADAIDKEVKRSQWLLHLPGQVSDRAMAGQLGTLYHLLWAPLRLTDGVHTVILSPDGLLNFVSFATLTGPDGRFLSQVDELRYVSCGRDLLLPGTGRRGTSMVILANPDFAGHYPPLPGTQREAVALQGVARQAGWSCQVYTGGQASKSRLQAVASPTVLHVATHGFFLADMRSGLVLADGILTAADVALLRLSQTWLVVLSACDTGSGEVRAGEGVLGLRRGFVLAGSRNLLMTLWPVADEATSAFMADFYRDAARSGNPSAALAEVQRAWLVRLRKQQGLSAAVRIAGPFVLSR